MILSTQIVNVGSVIDLTDKMSLLTNNLKEDSGFLRETPFSIL